MYVYMSICKSGHVDIDRQTINYMTVSNLVRDSMHAFFNQILQDESFLFSKLNDKITVHAVKENKL